MCGLFFFVLARDLRANQVGTTTSGSTPVRPLHEYVVFKLSRAFLRLQQSTAGVLLLTALLSHSGQCSITQVTLGEPVHPVFARAMILPASASKLL